ncbi:MULTISPECIES: enoyl-CoA hydratase/isomerase family protein [unclassified Xanthobacter]|uniref:enoyl-CoA hydratase/isomerase family protein n=1 Tax=unclassified Xanthobacter TaxID=2623496 RepID=UPI001EDF98C2|nr:MULTISPECIES: enoyl-CoA hydratase-related protein [unclassified Xanthobacter]
MSEVLYEVKEQVAVITLNRPEKLNAFTTEMLHAWADALLDSQRRDDVRVIVVTGAGRAFCAGGDVGSMDERKDDGPLARKEGLRSRVYRVPLALLDIDKPVLVAVNGVATGAGMDMALMGDIRIAGRSARFAETYVRIGIMAGDGGAWYLPRLIGMPKALELLWTGRFVEADEAERIGLVNSVVDDACLMNHTMDLAARIAAGPPLAIRFMKRAAYQGVTMDLRTHLDQVSSHMGLLFSSRDHKEAVAAYRERRPPIFEGR